MSYIAGSFGIIFAGLFALVIYKVKSSAEKSVLLQQQKIDHEISQKQIDTLANHVPAVDRLRSGEF